MLQKTNKNSILISSQAALQQKISFPRDRNISLEELFSGKTIPTRQVRRAWIQHEGGVVGLGWNSRPGQRVHQLSSAIDFYDLDKKLSLNADYVRSSEYLEDDEGNQTVELVQYLIGRWRQWVGLDFQPPNYYGKAKRFNDPNEPPRENR